MKKKQIDIDLLLPEIPDGDDACVQRVIDLVQEERGVSKVHLLPKGADGKAILCFHYDPNELYITDLENIAKKAGAEITDNYGHLLLEVNGVRHSRHARSLETNILTWKGVLFASVSGTGLIKIEYDKKLISEAELESLITGLRLEIPDHKAQQASSSAKKQKSHEHGANEEHHHHHPTIFGERTELIFAIITGVLLAIGFILSFFDIPRFVPIMILAVSYITGGTFAVMEAVDGLKKGHFEIDFLMIIAAIGAAILGRWMEGSFLLFLFSIGHSLEHYAFDKAKQSVAALVGLYPKTALVKRGERMEEVLVEKLDIGNVIIVRPNEIISADGIVISGGGAINEAPITGESMPVEKVSVKEEWVSIKNLDKIPAESRVFAGTINGNQPLEVFVGRLTADSTLSRLIEMVRNAQTQKSATQQFTDRVERYYVPFVLVLVAILLFAFLIKDESFGESFYRAMAVLIAASPCALAISTPSAVLSGISKAARGGVLIKGGLPLEVLGAVDAIAFDKTGTITKGKHSLTGMYLLNKKLTREQLIEKVVATEKLSDHPLAAAVVHAGEATLGREVSPAVNMVAYTAMGIEATYNGKKIRIGNRHLMRKMEVDMAIEHEDMMKQFEQEGNTTLLVAEESEVIGIVTLQDKPRDEAADTIARIKALGIKNIMILTGDNELVGESISKKVGIERVMGSLLPEEKVAAIKKWQEDGLKVAMVGDGVNDAPAMAMSNVGIAMGAAGSPIALETADIALMADNLSQLPYGIQLSRKTKRIVRQNLIISIGMVVLLVPLAIGGLSIAPAVIGHEGSTIIVVLNALRLFAFKEKK